MAPLVRKVYSSTAYLTMNVIPVVVNGGSSEKWKKHGECTYCGFERLFLSPRLLLELEIGTYQLVSLRCLI